MVARDSYLEKLKSVMWDGNIKVITGLRRSGKSTLLFELFDEYLTSNDVKVRISLNLNLMQKLNLSCIIGKSDINTCKNSCVKMVVSQSRKLSSTDSIEFHIYRRLYVRWCQGEKCHLLLSTQFPNKDAHQCTSDSEGKFIKKARTNLPELSLYLSFFT